MSWLKRLLGGEEERPSRPLEELLEAVAEHARPAARLVEDPEGTCQFGGTPRLPTGTEWPRRNGRALSFLVSLDLSAPDFAGIDWLPNEGRLHFFYDTDDLPWGFDPATADGWTVLYDSSPAAAAPLEAPTDCKLYPERRYSAASETAFPGWERAKTASALDMTEKEMELYEEEGRGASEKESVHRVGGYPDPIQADYMELECQLASNGIYCGDGSGYEDPRSKELEAGAPEWQMLLQLDGTDDWEWVEGGKLFFWVRESEARRADFSGTWLILQCY